MKIHTKYKLAKAVSNDVSRQILHNILIDAGDTPVAVATNGKIMAIVPVTIDEGDVLNESRKAVIPTAVLDNHFNGECLADLQAGKIKLPNGTSIDQPIDAGAFPAYKPVIPSKDGTLSVKLDAKLLVALIGAIGANKGCITLSLPQDHVEDGFVTGAVRVETGEKDVLGIIMPMR